MNKIKKIELLAPAKNLEIAIEAINHGADAVYIGSPQFSARAAAGNSLEDISTLVSYAHQFNAKVYVALNTILRDDELDDAEKLIWKLYEVGVDALIIQDMGITMLNLPPISLHASTQMDNRSIEKVKFLEDAGFSQVVLARELTINEIKAIASEVTLPLEVFVHGALCVSYSGQCYISEALSKRSANRGSCAQFCRLPYTLVDSEGVVVVKNKHLLSMKDLNLSDSLEQLLDAGVTSLKIEGRLKDMTYVKNVVAHYRQKLDEIFSERAEYSRSSSGLSAIMFTPKLDKTFNRGYTEYFLNERANDIWSVDSPKSVGELVGKVRNVDKRFFELEGAVQLNNGDGICFFDDNKELRGLRVNTVDGPNIYPAEHEFNVKKGTQIYRNFDHEFDKTLNRKSAERTVAANISLQDTPTGFQAILKDEDGNSVSSVFDYKKELAQTDQLENLKRNLSKTGNTIFRIENVDIQFSENFFIPASVASDWRRQLIEQLTEQRISSYVRTEKQFPQSKHAFPTTNMTYLGNVMNNTSRQFYLQHQVQSVDMAFEKRHEKGVPLMFMRHCIKYAMGWCPKENLSHTYKEPFFLQTNNTRLRLEFDCKACDMKVIKEDV